jgi:DNA gyrase subunit A
VIVEETLAIKEKFAEPRKTVILTEEKPGDVIVTEAELAIPDGPQVLAVTTQGVLRSDSKGFGYRVKPGVTSRAVEAHRMHLRTKPDDNVILISARGRVWWGAVGRLPRTASFEALGLGKDEQIVGMGLLTDEGCLVLGTRQGRVKRVKTEDVKSMAEGSWAVIIGLGGDDDAVLFAGVGGDDAQAMFFGTSKANRFDAGTVNPQATPSAKGVAGIKLAKTDQLLGGAVIGDPKADFGVVVVSKNGYIKRVPLKEFSVQGRGGQGVQLLNQTKATGPVVAVGVGPMKSAVDLIDSDGKRHRIAEVPETNRANRGEALAELTNITEVLVL